MIKMLLEALTFGLMGLGMYGMADEVKKIQKEHSEELQKNQEKLVEEMEENGYANFEEATAARVDYAMEKALFPGEPITTTIHALHACLMDDEDIIYKQTGKKYKKIKKEEPYEHNKKILQKLEDEGFEYLRIAMSILNIDVFSDKITPQMEEKLKIESENIKRR